MRVLIERLLKIRTIEIFAIMISHVAMVQPPVGKHALFLPQTAEKILSVLLRFEAEMSNERRDIKGELRTLLGSCKNNFPVVETTDKFNIFALFNIRSKIKSDVAPNSPNILDFYKETISVLSEISAIPGGTSGVSFEMLMNYTIKAIKKSNIWDPGCSKQVGLEKLWGAFHNTRDSIMEIADIIESISETTKSDSGTYKAAIKPMQILILKIQEINKMASFKPSTCNIDEQCHNIYLVVVYFLTSVMSYMQSVMSSVPITEASHLDASIVNLRKATAGLIHLAVKKERMSAFLKEFVSECERVEGSTSQEKDSAKPANTTNQSADDIYFKSGEYVNFMKDLSLATKFEDDDFNDFNDKKDSNFWIVVGLIALLIFIASIILLLVYKTR